MASVGPRRVKNLVATALAESFGNDLLPMLGLIPPPIMGPLPTAARLVQLVDRDMEDVCPMETGDCLHLEFQDRASTDTLRQLLVYDAFSCHREGRHIDTVVVYTGAVHTARDALDAGPLAYLTFARQL